MKRKNVTELSHKNTRITRNVDRIYHGCFEEYEDAADYIDIRCVLKGRVIA